MQLGYAVHEIRAAGKTIPAGSVASFSEEDFFDYAALGALRTPTDTEVALYRLTNRATAADTDEADEDMDPVRAALVAEAAELGVKFNSNASDSTLRKRIAEVRAKASL